MSDVIIMQEGSARAPYLQKDCIKAGAQLQHGIHFRLDLEQIARSPSPLLGQLGYRLACIVQVCALVHGFPDYTKAACADDLAYGVPEDIMAVITPQISAPKLFRCSE